MSKIVTCFTLCALLFVLCLSAEAQQTGKMPRISLLNAGSFANANTARIEAFRYGLRELGYVEGKNILVEYRFADGRLERLPELAAELVRNKVDIIVASGGQSVRAIKNATKTIPTVMVAVNDPVGDGVVAGLARPGGNITGLTTLAPELGGKRLELLREIIPLLSRVAVLGTRSSVNGPQMKEMENAARALDLQLIAVELERSSDLEKVFSVNIVGRAGGLVGFSSPIFSFHGQGIAKLALKNRLPSVYRDSDYVEAGGLMSYGPSYAALYHRAANYVVKILKGAKPADLPIEQPMKFELVINLKTAKQIEVTIPAGVLMEADKVIK